jgi:hypothetical protein
MVAGHLARSHTMKRQLTPQEKTRIIGIRTTKERADHPDAAITVYVDDETDDAGEPVVRVMEQTERVLKNVGRVRPKPTLGRQ